jgi:hypothetical protein
MNNHKYMYIYIALFEKFCTCLTEFIFVHALNEHRTILCSVRKVYMPIHMHVKVCTHVYMHVCVPPKCG